VTLSRKAIDSLKTALAITIAYAIALHMDWEQPRWAAITITLVSLATIGLCTYLMGGKKFEGYWMMSGFATAIIAVDAGLNAEASFEFVMLRLQQTLLGLITYIVVFVFLWPNDGYALFKAVSCKLASIQQQIYRVYRELMHDQLSNADKVQAAHALRM
jgi:uncharacterized membrane protein YccC